MLAAGIGRRLSGNDDTHSPKALLRFDGQTLLARHAEILRRCGVAGLVVVVGYREGEIIAEIAAIGAGDYVRNARNDDYLRGSMLSLWAARDILVGGDDILFMDADVLYHPHLIACLLASTHRDCLIFDRGFDPGDEPVKLCLKEGVIVEFRKKVEADYDTVGEWPGFMRLSSATAKRLVAAMRAYVEAGRLDEPYEEAMRDVMLETPASFGVEDVTGYPWIEIDFPSDLLRAERDVLPQLRQLGSSVALPSAQRRDARGP